MSQSYFAQKDLARRNLKEWLVAASGLQQERCEGLLKATTTGKATRGFRGVHGLQGNAVYTFHGLKDERFAQSMFLRTQPNHNIILLGTTDCIICVVLLLVVR